MSDPIPTLVPLKEQLNSLLLNKVRLFDELNEKDFNRINKPGTISHAMHHTHLTDQLLSSRISSKGSSGNHFLRVHITDLNGNTRLFGPYPGIQHGRSFDTGIIFSPEIEKKASWEGIDHRVIEYITEPILRTMTAANYMWDLEGLTRETQNEIYQRLDRCDINLSQEHGDNTGSGLGRLLATPLMLRVAHLQMDSKLHIPITPSLGALLSTIENNIVTPIYPNMHEIDMVILR